MSFVKFKTWLVVLVTLTLVACGGGGSSTSETGTPILQPGTGTGGTGSGTASPTVTLALSSATVTAASPATVSVTVRDAGGKPVAGTVVDLGTVRGSLGVLNVTSVSTQANGTATATLSAAPGGNSGADEVVAIAKLGTTTVQSAIAFTVAGSVPTLGLNISATTLRASTGAATLQAVLKDAAGAVVTDQVVSFASAAGRVLLSAPSAKTDGFGVATVAVSAADASLTAADTLVATATVAGQSLQSQVAVQLLADVPSIRVTASSSNVTATAPATLSVLVRDAANVPVSAGTIVSVSSTYGLTSFDAETALTDATGTARILVSPKTATSNGADQVVVSTVVGGVSIRGAAVVQVTSGTSAVTQPVLLLDLSSTSISAASPATVTATLSDGRGAPVPGQVVSFDVVRGLAKTNVGTALTDVNGRAVVTLSPASASSAGADEITASLRFAGTTLQRTSGFQIQATNVSLVSLTSAVASLGAYGQTTLTLTTLGASPGAPVNVGVTSDCVSLGKATLSPQTFTATTTTVDLQYKDNGCGALRSEDNLQATIVGTASSASLKLAISVPMASSLAFVSASPEVIYLKGSGFTESSTLTFEVRDGAGNILPNRDVVLSLLTLSGGMTMEGGTADVTQRSDAAGRVTVRVNSGSVPSPVRVRASLAATPTIATVSSNLSVAVGLPSQLNFSLSQQTRNIEGFDIDGTPNTYNIIASDRNGNPVPSGTSINFVTEGGQVEPIRQTALTAGLSRATAQFVSASPRPADGRVTITAYALGEESFIDQNGNNSYDAGEPFQDLGNLFKDRLYDGAYDLSLDEYVPTNIANTAGCLMPGASGAGATSATNALLALDASIPSVGGSTCDGIWSGAGRVYVRRAAETVLSTSAGRPLWQNTSGLTSACSKVTLQTGPLPASVAVFTLVGGDTWYTGSVGTLSTSLPLIVADANTFPAASAAGAIGRLNPMAAGTTVSATSIPSEGVTLTVSGSPVPSTSEASAAQVGVAFGGDTPPLQATVFISLRSPSGLITTAPVTVVRGARPTSCP